MLFFSEQILVTLRCKIKVPCDPCVCVIHVRFLKQHNMHATKNTLKWKEEAIPGMQSVTTVVFYWRIRFNIKTTWLFVVIIDFCLIVEEKNGLICSSNQICQIKPQIRLRLTHGPHFGQLCSTPYLVYNKKMRETSPLYTYYIPYTVMEKKVLAPLKF